MSKLDTIITALAKQIIDTNQDRLEEISTWTDEDIEEQLDMVEDANKTKKGAMIVSRAFLKDALKQARELAKGADKS